MKAISSLSLFSPLNKRLQVHRIFRHNEDHTKALWFTAYQRGPNKWAHCVKCRIFLGQGLRPKVWSSWLFTLSLFFCRKDTKAERDKQPHSFKRVFIIHQRLFAFRMNQERGKVPKMPHCAPLSAPWYQSQAGQGYFHLLAFRSSSPATSLSGLFSVALFIFFRTGRTSGRN